MMHLSVFLSMMWMASMLNVMYRFSFGGGKRHTLKHIGDELGISPETVRQIELRALKKLKGFSEELKEYVVT